MPLLQAGYKALQGTERSPSHHAQQRCHTHGRSSMLHEGSQLFFGLILQRVPGDALESSIHIDVLLGGCLKVGDAPLGCAPLLCLLLCHLQPSRLIRSIHCGIARCGALSWPCTRHMCSLAAVRSACSSSSQSHACSRCSDVSGKVWGPYHATPALIQIHLVPKHHEWKVLRV